MIMTRGTGLELVHNNAVVDFKANAVSASVCLPAVHSRMVIFVGDINICVRSRDVICNLRRVWYWWSGWCDRRFDKRKDSKYIRYLHLCALYSWFNYLL